MKFGKVLEEESVAEWRLKYLNYRQAKKKLKAVSRAIRSARTTPSTLKGRTPGDQTPQPRAPVFDLLRARRQDSSDDEDGHSSSDPTSPKTSSPQRGTPINIPKTPATEQSRLAGSGDNGKSTKGLTRYGSIVATPPDPPSGMGDHLDRAPSLRLPGPAISSAQSAKQSDNAPPKHSDAPMSPVSTSSLREASPSPIKINKKIRPHPSPLSNALQPVRSASMPMHSSMHKPSLVSRMLTFRSRKAVTFTARDEMPMEAYKDIEDRQKDFFSFLDDEMKMIDGFYKEKEEEATKRLNILREQLHIMRDRRMEEFVHANKHASSQANGHKKKSTGKDHGPNGNQHPSKNKDHDNSWLHPLDKAVDKAVDRAKRGHVGKTFQAMKDLGTPSGPSAVELYRDYTTKPAAKEVPYRAAKHKLKIALAEHYRGLELLKSYALLNRTAFRKITKKYDKMVTYSPGSRYMSDKVSKSYFVRSEVVDSHIHAVEDLYARYFERGNRKVAVSKLRAKIAKAGEFSACAFVNGLLLAAGCAIGVEGLVYAANDLAGGDARLVTRTQVLLQLYAGFFLAILLALFFCLACRIWHRNKVNYTFVFEFDTRRQILDWRQLAQIPSVLFFLLGLILWLDFRHFGGDMFLYWPIVLAGLVAIVLFNPLPIFFPKSRQWFAYSSWRLAFSGIYPVEFRDFFLGDLFCSQTYAMGNLELFACLYSQRPIWNDPPYCGSQHSRLLGFLQCLPGLWRLFQCLRRYKDTRNTFPHLVNGGKYLWTIIYYMSLSMYRIDHGTHYKAFFIAAAAINAIYCSVWDLVMDWSLLDPHAKFRLLRPNLAFKSTWPYYLAIVIDPIIRNNWILYAIYTEDLYYSAPISFVVGLSEVCRRGMWMVFRVENEHCTNVGRFRAYRDTALPYETTAAPTSASTSSLASPQVQPSGGTSSAAGHVVASPDQVAANLESGMVSPPHTANSSTPLPPQATSSTKGSNAAGLDGGSTGFRQQDGHHETDNRATELRRRKGASQGTSTSPLVRAVNRVGTLMRVAHTQDFERKRRGSDDGKGKDGRHDMGSPLVGFGGHGVDSDEDDDDDDDDDSDDEVHDGSDEEDEVDVDVAEVELARTAAGAGGAGLKR